VKSKRAIYLLLPLVIAVWGLIVWRIWSAASEPVMRSEGVAVDALRDSVAAARIRFPKLLLNYTDPFKASAGYRSSQAATITRGASLSVVALPHARQVSSVNFRFPIQPATTTAPVAAPINWPRINYLGIIAHANGQAQVALLTINGESEIIRIGKTAQGIQVLNIYRDSITVSFTKTRKSILRSTSN